MIGDFTDDFDNDMCSVGDPFACVGGISEDQFDERKRTARGSKQRDSSVAILNRGRMRLRDEKSAVSVDQRMAFAAFDLLSGVKASGAAAFRGLHRLTVDDRG